MWKECLLLSIITINICGSSNSAPLAKSGRSKNVRGYEYPKYQQATNEESHGVEYAEEDEEEEEYSTEGKLIGRWRNNGEALEPKWRDGDSVPLVPFYVATVQDNWHDELGSKGEQVAKGPAIHDEYSTKQYSKRLPPPRESNDQTLNRYDRMNPERSITNTERYPYDKHYEDTRKDRYKDYQSNERRLSKESKYPQPENFEDSNEYSRTNYSFRNYENIRDSNTDTSQKKVEDVPKVTYEGNENLEGVVMKYRETFQNRPDEYELSEDEYEKPRPRKRRPPQNDEFAEPRNLYPAFKSDENTSSETDPNSKSSQNEEGVNVKSPRRFNYSSRNIDDYHSITNGNSEVHDKLSENSRLKLLLKMQQDEELSLSEILQQKNLTLMDLLKGKANIVNVLKLNNKGSKDVEESSSTTTKSVEIIRTERPRWMPSRRSRTNSNETKEMSFRTRTGKVHFPQRFLLTKKKDNNNATNKNEKFPIVDELLTKFDPSNEPMTIENSTELFQSNPSNVKHDVYHEETTEMIDEDEIMEFSDFTVIKPKTATPKVDTSSETSNTTSTTTGFNNVHQDGVSTLSIEHILTSTEQTVIQNLSENISMINDEIGSLNVTGNDDKIRDKNVQKSADERIKYHGNYSSIFETFELKYQGDDMQQSTQRNDKIIDDEVQNRLNADRNCSENTEEIESTITDEVTLLNRDDASLVDRQNLTTNHKLYKDIISEVEPVTRAEIFELFNSSSSAKRLEQLLKSRNMSLDELIALRQRGSSEVHLAEVFRSREENLKYQKLNDNVNDTKSKSTNKTEINVAQSESIETTHDAYNDDPHAFLNTDKNKVGTNQTEDVNGITNSTYDYLNMEIEKLTSNLSDLIDYHRYREHVNTSSNDTKSDKHIDSINSNDDDQTANSKATTQENVERSTQVLDLMTAFDSLPFSKTIRQDSEGSSYYTSITEVKIPIHETYDSDLSQPMDHLERTKYPASSPTSFIEEGLVEEIVKNDLKSISEMYGLKNDLNDKGNALSKVKPSIIASGAILGVTIVVFLAIFIACRIRQKQKFTYKNAISKTVFQNSTMAARKLSNSSSLNTVMVNVIATSTTKRPQNHEIRETDDEDLESNSDIENDSLDANDSWETIPDFLK